MYTFPVSITSSLLYSVPVLFRLKSDTAVVGHINCSRYLLTCLLISGFKAYLIHMSFQPVRTHRTPSIDSETAFGFFMLIFSLFLVSLYTLGFLCVKVDKL